MQRTLIFIVVLIVLAVLFGYNYFAQPFKNLQWGQPPVAEVTSSPEPEGPTSEELLFDTLSTHDRIAQLIGAPVTWRAGEATSSAAVDWVRDHRPGFVILFGGSIPQTEAVTLINDIRAPYDATLSAMIMVDHEGGTVQRLSGEGFTRVPAWNTLCNQDATQSAELLKQSARELKAIGIDIVLAPVVDVGTQTTPLTSRICSDDPQLVSDRAQEWVKEFQQVGLTPVLKHFPGTGSVQRDLHFSFDRVTVTEKDTKPYLDILGAHPTIGVLVSHVGVTNQDPNIPCSLSGNCVGQILQNYPQVLIFTDSLEMKSTEYQTGTTDPKPLAQRAQEAILAGNDVITFGRDMNVEELSILISDLEKAYHESPTFKARVDGSVKKIIHFKVKER